MNKELSAGDLIALLSDVPSTTIVRLHGSSGDFSIVSGTVIFGEARRSDRPVSAPTFVQLLIDD